MNAMPNAYKVLSMDSLDQLDIDINQVNEQINYYKKSIESSPDFQFSYLLSVPTPNPYDFKDAFSNFFGSAQKPKPEKDLPKEEDRLFSSFNELLDTLFSN